MRAHFRHLSFQDLSNDVKKSSIQWLLSSIISFWRFGNPLGFQFPTLTLGLWPRQGVARLRAKKKTQSHITCSWECKEWTLTLPSELPCWELESQWTHESSEHDCKGQNPSPWKLLYIIGKLLKLWMSKMGSHCPFGHLKHKLWPKERSGVKLAIWLPTTKSQESTRFLDVQATCDIPLKSSRRGLTLWFRPHCNRSSAC
jgi:hypothetical protein